MKKTLTGVRLKVNGIKESFGSLRDIEEAFSTETIHVTDHNGNQCKLKYPVEMSFSDSLFNSNQKLNKIVL